MPADDRMNLLLQLILAQQAMQQQGRSDSLSAEYQQKLDQANQKNEDRYLDILYGRKGTKERVLADLERFGNSQIADANDRYKALQSQMLADVHARGFGGSSSMINSANRSAETARGKELARIQDDIINRRTNADAGLSDSLYSFMERRNDVPPDLSQLIALQQGLGQSGPMLSSTRPTTSASTNPAFGFTGGMSPRPQYGGSAMPNVMRGGNAMAGGDLLAQLMPFVTAGLLPSVLGSPFARPAGSATAFQGTPRPNMQLRGSASPPRSAGDAPSLPMSQFVRAWGYSSDPSKDYYAYERPGQQVPTIPGMVGGPIGGGGYGMPFGGVRPTFAGSSYQFQPRDYSQRQRPVRYSRPPQYQGGGSTMLPILGPSYQLQYA